MNRIVIRILYIQMLLLGGLMAEVNPPPPLPLVDRSDQTTFTTELPSIVTDRYRVERSLGRGSQGEVYKAYNRETGEPVAIKVYFSNGVQLAQISEIENEERISSALREVSILRRFVERLGDNIVVIEFIEGTTLEEIVESDAFTPEEADRWTEQLLDGMDQMLDRDVIPLDIALDNLMIDAERDLRVIDPALFIYLTDYLAEGNCQVFRADWAVSIGDQVRLVTPALATYLTASDIFDIVNVLRAKQGRDPLPSHLKPNFLNEYGMEGADCAHLESLRDHLREWISELREVE